VMLICTRIRNYALHVSIINATMNSNTPTLQNDEKLHCNFSWQSSKFSSFAGKISSMTTIDDEIGEY
jgi:hypothetical protein